MEMKCPVCKEIDLVMADRQGVEIDYCPDCRGIWLDRGELDKIIERSYVQPSITPRAENRHHQEGHDKHYYEKEHHSDQGYDHHGHYRRKSWLSEIFD
jgi:Zn-finger nucleic acid-binding protein